MSASPWEEITRRWKEVTDAQAEVASHWLETQSQLASTLAGVAGTVDPTADAAAMADVWRSSMALGGMLTRGLPGTEAGGIANEMLTRLLNPMSTALSGGNQVGDIVRRMTEGPRFADVGLLERRMAEVLDLYLKVQTATRAYESVVATAWTGANKRFTDELAERNRAGKRLGPGKEALSLWMDIANQSLLKTHRSPEFLVAQRDLLRASMDFLLAERGLFEQLVEPVGLPTRSEIDEVHRTVQSLKRRIRKLEDHASGRSSAAATGQTATGRTAAAGPAKKAAANGTSAKKTSAKKTPAKKTPAKKTPARKTPARKSTDGGAS